tara:strand:+ start:2232 stop:2684 length:453 start_codon:yes stop_codon:yes gene_type:complete
MHPPGYEENFPPPYSAASQIEEYLTTIIRLQNKVTRLEDILERTQRSCDKRIKDSNIYIQQLEATIFYYQNSGVIPSQRRAYQPTQSQSSPSPSHLSSRLEALAGRGLLQLRPQDVAEMEAEIGSDLDRETSSDSDSDDSFGDDLQDNNS